jgi:hypothetical protein
MHRLKVKEWNKLFYANEIQKKTGVTKFTANKTDFKIKNSKKDKAIKKETRH